jgi:hypothetical protein
MIQSGFDPFGEPVTALKRPVGSEGASKWLKSFATGLFWMLVTAIVLARAFYFEPGMFIRAIPRLEASVVCCSLVFAGAPHECRI